MEVGRNSRICSGNSAKIEEKLSTKKTSFAPKFSCCAIVNLWHDSSQRKRDLPEKREESEAARIGNETHFGQPKTGIGNETHTSGDRRHAADEGSSQDLRNRRTRDKRACSHDLSEEGTRRLTWCRNQVFEDSDGGRAGPRERNRPKAFKGTGWGLCFGYEACAAGSSGLLADCCDRTA